MGAVKNLVGNNYGKLTVLELVDTGKKGSRWLCQCECGNTSVVHSQSLRRGMTKSCGSCPNPVEVCGCVVKVRLAAGEWFIINIEDYNKIKPFRWCKDGRGYVMVRVDGAVIKLHRFLLGATNGYEVDHIDLNPLNNVRSNLRLATRQQNSFNIPARKSNSTGFLGVSYDKRTQQYTASLMCDGKSYWGGRHATAIEAAKARDELASRFHGEFACLNF